MKTYLPKVNVDERKWRVIDADGAVLDRACAGLIAEEGPDTRQHRQLLYSPGIGFPTGRFINGQKKQTNDYRAQYD